MTLWQLFWSFVQVGMFSVGGGYAAIPLVREQAVVGHAWLTMSEFADLVTIAEMTPGPITVNAATFVGARVAGPVGAVVATLGCIAPALVIVSALAYVYYRWKNLAVLQSVLASLRPAVVALIAGAGLSILKQVVFEGQALAVQNVNWLGVGLFLAAFAALRRFKANPIAVMLCCGAAGLLLGVFGA